MSDNRIVLRLNERIAFERDFSIQYRNVPRARRQEWVRSILMAGMAGVESVARGASIPAPAQAANVAVLPAEVAVVPAAVLAAPAAPQTVIKPVVKSKPLAGELKGFFPATPGNNP